MVVLTCCLNPQPSRTSCEFYRPIYREKDIHWYRFSMRRNITPAYQSGVHMSVMVLDVPVYV